MMDNFCKHEERIALLGESNTERIVTVIAEKYIEDNPECDYEMRAFPNGCFKSNNIGRTIIDLDKVYPNAKRGDYAYAAMEIKREAVTTSGLAVIPYGAVSVYHNGKEIFTSPPQSEPHKDIVHNVIIAWKPGRNSIVFRFKKLTDGFFGAEVSSNSPKWAPMVFDFPSELCKGAVGFAYSELIDAEKKVPCDFKALKWYPEQSELKKGKYVAWSCFSCNKDEEISFKGCAKDGIELLIDDKKYTFCGEFKKKVFLEEGKHDLLLLGEDYKFDIAKKLCVPGNVTGTKGKFIYMPYGGGALKSYRTFDRVINGNYWKTEENADVRVCLKAPLFGKWSYPLGVTLTGLYRAGKELGRRDFVEYVKKHVLACIRKYEYSLWDMETYGYPNINQQMLWFNVLDDIGSFGALILEVYQELDAGDKKTVRKIAKRIATHIMKKEIRREDGAFYRIAPDKVATMWSDDLYMCVPFLINYSKLTGDDIYIEEAVKQMLLYKKYLYMPEEKILSHTYNFNMNGQSKMPWGRGNGWAMYSLAKIIEAIPKGHKKENELKSYFNDLADGYISYQADSGHFRQLINRPDFYEETSCTAMLLYAFSSAVGKGFANDKKLKKAAEKAALGLINKSVDIKGNVYGVCRGSYCSFDPEYYRNLLWSTNDTHGIGIVMLGLLKYNEIG